MGENGKKKVKKKFVLIICLLVLCIIWIIPTGILVLLKKYTSTEVIDDKAIISILDLYNVVTDGIIYSIDLEDKGIIYENSFDINLKIENFDEDSAYKLIIKLDNEEMINEGIDKKEKNIKVKLDSEGKKEVNIIIYKNNIENINLTRTIYYIEPYKTQFLEEETDKGIKIMYNKSSISDADWDKSIDLTSKLGATYIRVAANLSLASNKDYLHIDRLMEKTKGTNIRIATAVSDIGEFGGEDKKINTNEELENLLDIVEYITTRYSSLKNIEIFNEPNYMKPSYSTEQEIEYYSKIVKEVSATAKRINPNIKIIAGSVACTSENTDGKVPYKTFLNKITQYGAYKYSDAYSYHPYEFYRSNAQNLTYYGLLLDSKNELNNYGGFIGNYITEYGVSNYKGNEFTEDTQAIRLVQQATINDRLGIDFSLIYVLRNPGTNVDNAEHNFGLLSNNYTPKLSYYAMKNYYENTNGAEYVGTLNIAEGLETHIYNKDGNPKIITWSDNEKNKITIPYQNFKAKNLYGKDIEPDKNGNITITTSPIYLENVDYNYFYDAISNMSIDKYAEFKEKFSTEIEKVPGLLNEITQLEEYISNIKNISMEIGERESIQLMQKHYKLGDLIIQSYQEGKLDIEYVKLSSILDMLDDIGNSYEDLITISAKTINESELKETNRKIQNLEITINNKDLEMIYPSKILETSKELYEKSNYINSLEEDNDIKLGLIVSKYIHSKFLANWAEEFAQLYIEQYVSENPVEIKYSEIELTNKDVIATIQTNADIQITNNNGSKAYTFEKNGTFTYEYIIKGQVFTKTAEVKNIDKNNPQIIGIEDGKIYKNEIEINVVDENLSEVKIILNEEKIEYKPNMKLVEEGFYTVTAKDKAGNTTSIKFEILEGQEEYQIKEEIIQNIINNTRRIDFEQKLNMKTPYEIERNTAILKEDDTIATGDILKTSTGEEYMLIVTGDINKDGDVNIKDLIKMRKHLLGEKELDDSERLAADCNFDGKKLNIKDFIRMRIIALTKSVI